MLILCINIAFACQEYYQLDEKVIIADIIVNDGIGAVCNITVYNTNGLYINNTQMNNYSNLYNISLGILPKDFYTSKIECDKSSIKYYGSCNFKVTDEEQKDKMMGINISIIIMIIFFIIIGVVTLYITRIFEIETSKLSFWIIFISFAMAIIEILVLVLINYMDYIGTDITSVIETNTTVAILLFFFIALLSLVFVMLNMFSLEKLFGIKPKEKY